MEDNLNGDGYLSPLKLVLTEAHEVYLELLAVGFPIQVASEIMSRLISDALAGNLEYANAFVEVEIEDEGEAEFEGFDEDPII